MAIAAGLTSSGTFYCLPRAARTRRRSAPDFPKPNQGIDSAGKPAQLACSVHILPVARSITRLEASSEPMVQDRTAILTEGVEEELQDCAERSESAEFEWQMRSTSEMINDCFRHQHPEAYGRDPVPQASVPWDLQCGRDHLVTSGTSTVPEEPQGNPGAHALDS